MGNKKVCGLYSMMKLELKKKKHIIKMVFKQVCGQNGSLMDKKTKKDIFLMERGTVSGPHGMKTEIKNYRLHILMGN